MKYLTYPDPIISGSAITSSVTSRVVHVPANVHIFAAGDDITLTAGSTDTASVNGQTYIVLQNREEVLLPSVINKVPALLLLNQNYKVVFGNEILNHLKPAQKTYKEVISTKNEEPMAFSLNGLNDIVSDTYSFLDQSADDLSAKGEGGMRQIHQYSTLNSNTSIVTPEETYQANTLGKQNFDLDKFQRQREQDIK